MDYQSLSIDELVRECAENSCNEAWQEFRRRFNRLIASVVIRGCREWGKTTAPDVIEDLIQDIYLKLCTNDSALLKEFKSLHENAFLGFLKKVTANVVYDHFRAQHAGKRDVGSTVELDETVNPNRECGGDLIENEIFFNQVDKILRLRGNGPQEQKERAIFWLYYRHGMTSKAIASIPAMDLTVKGVESCIFRLTVYVKQAVLKRKRGENPGGIQAAGSF